jgi:hypothetical protein
MFLQQRRVFGFEFLTSNQTNDLRIVTSVRLSDELEGRAQWLIL